MERTPVILQVLPALDIGGVEQGTIEIAAAITQVGGRALVASGPGRLLTRLNYVGGKHFHLPLPKAVSPFSLRKKVSLLRSIIRQNKVEIVHARSRYPAWVAAIACEKENIPLVTTWHGVHQARSWLKRKYNQSLLKGERVIAVSHHLGQRLQEEYHISSEKMRVIPRGCDPNMFDPENVSGKRIQDLAEKWNIPDGVNVLLVPGRLTQWKGQKIVLKALGRVMQNCFEPWVCVLVGPQTNPSYAQSLYFLARSLGISERIRFVGTCTDMPAAYRLAHCVIVPSLKAEPFGRVAVEAQMMGCPLIGTSLGGIAETVLHGETGLLVPPGDDVALSSAIISYLTSSEAFLSALSQNARHHVLSSYTTFKMQAATLGVYDEILKTTLRERFLEKYSAEYCLYQNDDHREEIRYYVS